MITHEKVVLVSTGTEFFLPVRRQGMLGAKRSRVAMEATGFGFPGWTERIGQDQTESGMRSYVNAANKVHPGHWRLVRVTDELQPREPALIQEDYG